MQGLPDCWRACGSLGAGLAAISLLLGGCAVPDPTGKYRFQAELERDGMAFRHGLTTEPLVVMVKLQNLSEQTIQLAPAEVSKGGAVVTARVANQPAFIGQPTVVVGYRGGARLRAKQDAAKALWSDRHAAAVQSLASVGPTLLHLQADDVRTSLGLMSNEGAVAVVLPVDWTLAPKTPQLIPVEFDLSIAITYQGAKGQTFVFPGELQRHMTAWLVNGARYASGTLPAPNGPIEGEFVAKGP